MENVIVVLILLAIVAGIVRYLVRAKKKGQKCIGCPYSGNCENKGSQSCGKGENK